MKSFLDACSANAVEPRRQSRCLSSIRRRSLAASLLALVVVAGLNWPSPVYAQNEGNTGEQVEDPSSASTAGSSNEGDATGSPFDFVGDAAPISVDQLREMQEHFGELAADVADATVNIRVGNSQGSGVIVTRDGYVMTAAHVIGGANLDATITLNDGTEIEAKTLGLNRTVDSGLLKLTPKSEQKKRFPYLPLGESGVLKSGQWVMAIGHPGGLDPDRGLVYRVGRILQSTDSFISTDCTLVGGDSGGPLVDMDGNVIAIHSRIGASLSSNVHVPVDVYSTEWDDLVAGKDWGSGIGGSNPANEPWLGFSLDEDDPLVIDDLSSDGPAEESGLKAGDKIIEFDGQRITSQRRLRSIIRDKSPGDVVTITVSRDGEEIKLELKIGSRADDR